MAGNMSLALGKHWLQEKNLLANVLMGFGQSLGQRKHSREREDSMVLDMRGDRA